jgi:hypothetical protein
VFARKKTTFFFLNKVERVVRVRKSFKKLKKKSFDASLRDNFFFLPPFLPSDRSSTSLLFFFFFFFCEVSSPSQRKNVPPALVLSR